jgi:hypothetical protein
MKDLYNRCLSEQENAANKNYKRKDRPADKTERSFKTSNVLREFNRNASPETQSACAQRQVRKTCRD